MNQVIEDLKEQLSDIIETYDGFTESEKEHALGEIDEWIGKDDNIEAVIAGFEEMSLDITPLLENEGLL